LIYETIRNPKRIANGKYFETTGYGKGGIVAAVELVEEPHLAPDIHENYGDRVVLTEKVIDNGRLIQWRYMARTRTIKEGFLGLSDITRLLGKLGWNPRIRGGISGVSQSDFEKLFGNID